MISAKKIIRRSSLLLLLFLVTFSTFSCKKDHNTLENTTWFWASPDGNWETFIFSNKRNMIASGNNGGLGYSFHGTYSFNDPNISITFDNGQSINGVVDGNTMTFSADLVYIKQ